MTNDADYLDSWMSTTRIETLVDSIFAIPHLKQACIPQLLGHV
jgi:hypothetical protein